MEHRETKATFGTGAQRDDATLKGRPSLISPLALTRLAVLLEKGAEHYGDRNWEKGMPYCRTADSMIRHIFQWLAGCDDEDHLAAVMFGAMALIHYEETLPNPELDDRPHPRQKFHLKKLLTRLDNEAKIQTTAEKPASPGTFECVPCGMPRLMFRDDHGRWCCGYCGNFGKVTRGVQTTAEKRDDTASVLQASATCILHCRACSFITPHKWVKDERTYQCENCGSRLS